MDPKLVPLKPMSGCPAGSNKYFSDCCCANGCCWRKCGKSFGPKPPMCGLEDVNATWKWNEAENWYIAQQNIDHSKYSGIRACSNVYSFDFL